MISSHFSARVEAGEEGIDNDFLSTINAGDDSSVVSVSKGRIINRYGSKMQLSGRHGTLHMHMPHLVPCHQCGALIVRLLFFGVRGCA